VHKKTHTILKNLGIVEDSLKDLNSVLDRERLQKLKTLKLPNSALSQIKQYEDYPVKNISGSNSVELVESLIKKCKRSFTAFAKKKVKAQIVFKDGNWVIYGEEYDKAIQKLHEVCKPYFDAWSSKGLKALIIFDGTTKWRAKASKNDELV